MSTIYNVWRNRILMADEISHHLAVTLGHYRVGRGKRNNLTDDEIRYLVNSLSLRDVPLRADAESTATGLRWLRSLAYTHTGNLRKRNPFTDVELDIIETATHIELTGYDGSAPVYRVVSPLGTLTYHVAWNASQAMSGLGGRGAPIHIHS